MHPDDAADWRARNVPVFNENRFKLGVFGQNCSSGSNKEEIRAMGERFIAGWGGYPLVGTPEQVVDKMVAIADIGVEGFILSWLDYYEEMKYFGETVMPLMRQAGLRV